MSQWIKSPREFAPGTKMTFAGISSGEDRANLLAFLNTKGDSPLPLPAAPAPAANPAEAAAEKAGDTAGAGQAPKEPVPTEQQMAPAAGGKMTGEGAPAVAGRAEQTKKQ